MKRDIVISDLPCPLENVERLVTSTAPVNNLAPPGIVSDHVHTVHIVVVLLEYMFVCACLRAVACLIILFSSLGISYHMYSSSVTYSI